MSDAVIRCAARSPERGFQRAWLMPCIVAISSLVVIDPSAAETLPEALVKAYQTNPQLNAERARQRGTDENVPQALAGYRPQIVASLSATAGAATPAAEVLVPVRTFIDRDRKSVV